MATAPVPYLTADQYLEQEPQAEFRSEYVQGEVFAMPGNTLAHGRLVTNLTVELSNALRQQDIGIYNNEIRLGVPQAELYTYPDVMVICGTPQMRDQSTHTVLNPALLIEVLSPSTEAYDRGRKFEMYRAISSLREYIIVAQDRIYVEQYLRQPSGDWLLKEHSSPHSSLHLSLDVQLNLTAVYERVFPDKSPEPLASADIPRIP